MGFEIVNSFLYTLSAFAGLCAYFLWLVGKFYLGVLGNGQ